MPTAEIAKATVAAEPQHSRVISGHVTKKRGLAVESSKNESDERTYRIAQ
jgi:hypothetical protein